MILRNKRVSKFLNFKMLKIKGIEAVAWDLDGTILDSFDVFCKIIAEQSELYGVESPTKKYIANNYHGMLVDNLKKIFVKKDIQEIIDDFIELEEKHYIEDINHHFFDDAIALVTSANELGIKQIIVTNRGHNNGYSASPHSMISRSVIKDFIHEIRCADQVEFRKPDARVMHDWLATHNIRPEKVLVVGDQYVDAQLALNLSARAVLVSRGVEIPHLDILGKDIIDKVFIVKSLHDIKLS